MYSLYNGINATELEPSEFSVGQNYPNPFKEKTVIKYCVAYKTKVQITVYNSEGKLIEKLVDEEKKPGTYEVAFQLAGSLQLAMEEYIYRFEAGGYSCDKKMVHLQ
jgi:endoglucanase Acf2